MTRKYCIKLIHEGEYVAEVDIKRLESEEGWGPYLSIEDARKLDEVRDAMRRGDLKTAAKSARVFRLMPIAA